MKIVYTAILLTTSIAISFHSTGVQAEGIKETLYPSPVLRICPRKVGGDREFGGNGPDVNASARLRISNDRRALYLQAKLDARETKSNWSHAKADVNRLVAKAPRGYLINRILSEDYSTTQYRDRNHDIDRPRVRGGLVDVFEIMGDTPGNDIGNCTDDDVFMNVYLKPVTVELVAESRRPRNVSFTPDPIRGLCPSKVGGDREFGGNGPDVTASANIRISGDRRSIVASMYLDAKETRSDWSRAKGEFERHIYTAPDGFVVTKIHSDRSSNTKYRDTNHSMDTPPVRGGRLVKIFSIKGDTRGNDIGRCTSDDVFMSVFFNTVHVRIEHQNAGG